MSSYSVSSFPSSDIANENLYYDGETLSERPPCVQYKPPRNVAKLDGLRVQLASDIHLEFYDTFDDIPEDMIVPCAPYLALAGDIGYPYEEHFERWLVAQSTKFKKVLLVAGNHEYYCYGKSSTSGSTEDSDKPRYSVSQLKSMMTTLCDRHENIIYMDRTSIVLEGVRVLGTTLWCHVPKKHRPAVESGMNDFNKIYLTESSEYDTSNSHSVVAGSDGRSLRRFKVDDFSRWGDAEARWLEEEVIAAREDNVLVITHYIPTFKSLSHKSWKMTRRTSMHAFASNLEHLFREHPSCRAAKVHTWAYGHLHSPRDQLLWGTRVVANTKGYPPGSRKYNNTKVLFIPRKTTKEKRGKKKKPNAKTKTKLKTKGKEKRKRKPKGKGKRT